ncbi:tRNA dihydrouridine synthase DusB [Rhodoblastus acidophilus]|uniref:tRNA-dihydrouridine synthase n=1 Tax=Candidatus Rhodoblastus alkanivorans TaxID=2954117 RepID=A0ABS9Z833_9HYPH|nr:tRNA dihydrouridine synthase DusB [Candidatus Rhodoblastus alkanivorans]MCI4677950.1 tRNA dihydrouridine synthase DusB [Candidatus Rhodoblastus alkanivorans]MCI4683845.1 tRNA dihydrouridine synthase DusB [Candidatus Rhodoblastus alkanivorans]MDI4641163.1 tRNA dihydrouridine synthase DusB [Rhodoblastus acidophilus]
MNDFAQQVGDGAGAASLFHAPASVAPLRVGGLTIDAPAFLAPMAGVTDLAMRRLARRFGAGLAFSEMVASDDFAQAAGGKAGKFGRESVVRAMGEGVSPHAVQIAGREPESLAEAARLVADAGADLIDINMGCPAKRVVGGAAGSALMRDLDLAARLIAAVTGAVKVPVSVKMRLGWDEASLNAPELARRAEAEGAAMVIVHGRTRNQFYRGAADWAAIGPVCEAVEIPVVANGDCRSPRDAWEMLAQSGAKAVMIGRAALGRPWIVGDIAYLLRNGRARPALSPQARRDAAREHVATLMDLLGSRQGLRHARKHLAAYADVAAEEGGGLDAAARRRLVETEDAREVFDLLCRLYERAPDLEAA